MKEKISRNKISSHYKSFFELENMALDENDSLMIDWGESLINELVNQEVEKRIAERMPSEEEFTLMVTGHIPWAIKPTRKSKTQFVNPFSSGNAFVQVISILSENMYKELRSRLTNPDNNPK